MYEIHDLEDSDLLAFLNSNKGDVVFLKDLTNSQWKLVFRRSVMGRPPKNIKENIDGTVSKANAGKLTEFQVATPQTVEPTIPLGFPQRYDNE